MDKQTKIQKIKELAEEINVFWRSFGKPINSSEIQEMESKLNLCFPKEYKEFLTTFGSLSAPRIAEDIGEPPIVEKTLNLRECYPDSFPGNIIVINGDGYGNYYCIVCNGKDNGKVIFWQHDAPSEEVYPRYPEGQPDFWIEGPDFWTWLLKKLQQIKELEDEEDLFESENKEE